MKRLMVVMALAIGLCLGLGGVALADHVPESSCGGASFTDCGGVHPDFMVGENSCNGIQACFDNQGDVGNDSCNGDSACPFNEDRVGNNECNGFLACSL